MIQPIYHKKAICSATYENLENIIYLIHSKLSPFIYNKNHYQTRLKFVTMYGEQFLVCFATVDEIILLNSIFGN